MTDRFSPKLRSRNISSGTVANADASLGFACILERRAVETGEQGQATTPYLSFGDRIRIEMLDRAGRSLFGAIEQEVVRYEGKSGPSLVPPSSRRSVLS